MGQLSIVGGAQLLMWLALLVISASAATAGFTCPKVTLAPPDVVR
jgi:hypothetical protein